MNAMQARHVLLVAVIASATATAQDHAHHQMHAATVVQVDSGQAVEMPAPMCVDDADEPAVAAAASAPTSVSGAASVSASTSTSASSLQRATQAAPPVEMDHAHMQHTEQAAHVHDMQHSDDAPAVHAHAAAPATDAASAVDSAHQTQTHVHGAGGAQPHATPATQTQTMDNAGRQHHAMHDMPHADPASTAQQAAHQHTAPAATTSPREPIPAPTADDIAAAFAPLRSHAMHGAGINHYVLLDRLEASDNHTGSGQDWEARAWLGGDIDRLWLRSEGERRRGQTHDASLEAFYGHAISPWWDVLLGARQDLAPGQRQSWAAIGVQGLAPYKFETEATLYLGSGGRAAFRLEAEYDVLLTNRLILQPRVEADVALTDDDRRGIGSGLEEVEAGLRLRYEITRKFAPYIGWVHSRRFGDSAQRADGDDTPARESRFVAGVRVWF
ncbi:copper resistance protein B [Xanthomonas campestris]|uniref:copper resistance protein B n=1 Tax=Xanthomonas campestris TaxID=339 RepID=UPI001E38E439|nr:copper resistance protein B [Xanthomonas campestris]MCC8686985.1 copper resistance protein B [Xanthomonas campestris]MEA9680257.1 copper resistance protein B [Xanthomonas campestris pv. raphani]MEA9700163.1 copper resistance protein B [Xanthomonas campestris pv. raphani]MEA9780851.1 copper resistance protein B [Xanthomonas campestris pv. raphani]MEA9860137.1 copper resistance protein B [Xanthomonas campestris pv. raphani]